MVDDAPVYIYGKGAKALGEVKSGDVLKLAEGRYDLLAAFVELDDGQVRRHFSPVVHVQVVAGDQVSVILPLRSVGRHSDGLLPIPLAVLPKQNTRDN